MHQRIEYADADRRAVNGSYAWSVCKLRRIGDTLVGYSGSASRAGEYLAWLQNGRIPSDYPKQDEREFVYLLVIHRDGMIERFEESGYPIIVEERQFAAGSGRDYALAAMHLGHDAAAAVGVACHFSPDCGNGVDTLTFGPHA